MANKIRSLRKTKHVTLESLEEMTGISSSFLSRIESGSRGLSLENAIRIARALQCDVVDITNEYSEDDIEHAAQLVSERPDRPAGDITHLTVHAGMGNGGMLSVERDNAGFVPDEYVDGAWSFPATIKSNFRKLSATYSIPVVGDSMEPTIPGGSVAFIDTSHVLPSPPDLYAVDYGDGLMVKRIELVPRSDKVRVISDNNRYETYEMQRDDLRVYGRVVASFQWRG